MSQTAVLVWLSAAPLLSAFQADLTGFAQTRLLRLEAPHDNAPSFRAATYSPDVALQIEVLLEEARSATASLEQSRALAALEHAERLLREHPELPQAAWLMAEQLDLTAEVESTALDGAAAASALRKRAAVLEGARAQPFSDHPPSAEPEAPVLRAVSVGGLEPADSLEWDGVPGEREVSTATGEHHARVSRNGRLVWAGWVALTGSETSVRLAVPATPPCSPDDIGAGRFEAGRAVGAAHARCESYVLARAHSGGGIEVASCEREICGVVTVFRHAVAAPSNVTAEHGWPRWATYTAVAAATVLTTGFVLWRTGVFDRPAAQTTTTWVYAGEVKPMGFRF